MRYVSSEKSYEGEKLGTLRKTGELTPMTLKIPVAQLSDTGTRYARENVRKPDRGKQKRIHGLVLFRCGVCQFASLSLAYLRLHT